MFSLESPPPSSQDRSRERRWAVVSLTALALALGLAALAVNRLRQSAPAPAPAVDHGPLPAAVRASVQVTLDEFLLDAQLEEGALGPVREFRVKGRTRAPLAQDFYAGFRPAVVNRLMPLLRPYGEILSFDVASLDLPPARLRPLPSKD